MLNPKQKLNPHIFDAEVEMQLTRKGFGEGLLIAGEKNKQVVGLCADLTDSTYMNLFRDKFSERFIQMGVAEQSMVSVASGMSAMGKIPFVASYAIFSPGRSWEQIRTTVCYNNQNVKIIGSHAGISVGPDGGSHQALEDIAITRVIPRLTVISPCDAEEAKKATIAAADFKGPVYIRLSREKTAVITTKDSPFEIGKAQLVFESQKPQVGIIATGPLLFSALKVAENLRKENIAVSVLNLSTIKPLDEHAVLLLAKTAGALVTVEEHQIHGGMGSVVSECLSATYPVPIEFVGTNDVFGESGKSTELIEKYGMGIGEIEKAVKKVLSRKPSLGR